MTGLFSGTPGDRAAFGDAVAIGDGDAFVGAVCTGAEILATASGAGAFETFTEAGALATVTGAGTLATVVGVRTCATGGTSLAGVRALQPGKF